MARLFHSTYDPFLFAGNTAAEKARREMLAERSAAIRLAAERAAHEEDGKRRESEKYSA